MLHAGGYGSRAARRLLRRHGGASEAEAEADAGDSAPPPVAGIADGGTGHELCSTGVLLRLRAHPSLRDSLLADAPQPLGVLVLLFLLGAAVRTVTVEHALGAASLAALREHGLLLPAREDSQPLLPVGEGSQSTELLASPVQIYPVPTGTYPEPARRDTLAEGATSADEEGASSADELLVATDWARESLIPAKFAVMPIGDPNPDPDPDTNPNPNPNPIPNPNPNPHQVVSTAVMDFVVEDLEQRLLRDEQISAAISQASSHLPTSPHISPSISPHLA